MDMTGHRPKEPHTSVAKRDLGSVEEDAVIRRRAMSLNVEHAILGVVASISILIGVLHSFGVLESEFLHERLPSITLAVVGLMAAYMIVERRGWVERLDLTLKELALSDERISQRLDSIDEAAVKVVAGLDGLSGDRFAELKLVYGLRSYSTVLSRNEIKGTADQVFDLWADSLREASTFWAFNYVNPDEVWATKGWAFNVAHALQVARVRLGCVIKRVFIIDSIDEHDTLEELMSRQSDSGIEVKWVLKAELAKEPLIGQYVRDVGTWDFVVIDSELLFRVQLDELRRIKGCSLLRDRELCRKASYAFNEAFHVATAVGAPPGRSPVQ